MSILCELFAFPPDLSWWGRVSLAAAVPYRMSLTETETIFFIEYLPLCSSVDLVGECAHSVSLCWQRSLFNIWFCSCFHFHFHFTILPVECSNERVQCGRRHWAYSQIHWRSDRPLFISFVYERPPFLSLSQSLSHFQSLRSFSSFLFCAHLQSISMLRWFAIPCWFLGTWRMCCFFDRNLFHGISLQRLPFQFVQCVPLWLCWFSVFEILLFPDVRLGGFPHVVDVKHI